MAAVKYGVKCDKHGVMDSKRGWKVFVVGVPHGKKKRFLSGCPVCKSEAAKGVS